MPTTTSYQLGRAPWLVDWENTPRDLGHQIDWGSVSATRINSAGKKYVPDGSIMALLASGKMIPRDDVDISPAPGDQLGTETAVGLLLGEANEADRTDALTGYGLLRGGVVYENILPDKAHASFAAWLGEMAANGSHFIYLTHVNTAAS
jgi:hypothetical protein